VTPSTGFAATSCQRTAYGSDLESLAVTLSEVAEAADQSGRSLRWTVEHGSGDVDRVEAVVSDFGFDGPEYRDSPAIARGR
jgi:hypothetical protein